MDILEILKNKIKSCFLAREIDNDDGIYYIAGNQTLPPPLPAAEEEIMLQRLEQNDFEARQILVEHNLRLVAHIVKKYSDKMDNVDDLISIGTIGLIKGIDSFSKSNGAKITTYCARCIENAHLT